MVHGFKENKSKEEIYSKSEIDGKIKEVSDKIVIPTKLSELENDTGYAVKTEVDATIEAINDNVSTVSTENTKKTVYSDITIESHTVDWNGGQIFVGRNRVDSTSKVTKSGYYPIGVVNVVANSTTKYYLLRGHSNKTAGALDVTYSYYANGNESIAPNDMPTATILVAWAKIR